MILIIQHDVLPEIKNTPTLITGLPLWSTKIEVVFS